MFGLTSLAFLQVMYRCVEHQVKRKLSARLEVEGKVCPRYRFSKSIYTVTCLVEGHPYNRNPTSDLQCDS